MCQALTSLVVHTTVVFFFFFQAEDGIRDKLVTGVQTCALPISAPRRGTRPHAYRNETAGATAAAPLGPPTGSRPPHGARPATRNARGPGRAPERHRSPREPPAACARGAAHAASGLPLSRPVLMPFVAFFIAPHCWGGKRMPSRR